MAKKKKSSKKSTAKKATASKSSLRAKPEQRKGRLRKCITVKKQKRCAKNGFISFTVGGIATSRGKLPTSTRDYPEGRCSCKKKQTVVGHFRCFPKTGGTLVKGKAEYPVCRKGMKPAWVEGYTRCAPRRNNPCKKSRPR